MADQTGEAVPHQKRAMLVDVNSADEFALHTPWYKNIAFTDGKSSHEHRIECNS